MTFGTKYTATVVQIFTCRILGLEPSLQLMIGLHRRRSEKRAVCCNEEWFCAFVSSLQYLPSTLLLHPIHCLVGSQQPGCVGHCQYAELRQTGQAQTEQSTHSTNPYPLL